MKIVLQYRDYVEYAAEAAAASDAVKNTSSDEGGLVLAIHEFNRILVKLSGFQQDTNSDSVDKLTADVAFKELRLARVKEELAAMKSLIADRLSVRLDPLHRHEQFAGLETLRFMTWAFAQSKPMDINEIGATNVSDVCRSAVIYLTRKWSFEIKLSMFKCCSTVGIRRPLSQVVKELYAMEMAVFLASCYPGYSAQMALATEELTNRLNIGEQGGDSES